MAKSNGTGIVLAGLAGFAASYLCKKENRDKTLEMFNSAKSKLETYLSTSKVDMDSNVAERVSTEATTEAGTNPTKLRSNDMVSEGGGHTGVHFYNEEIQAKEK